MPQKHPQLRPAIARLRTALIACAMVPIAGHAAARVGTNLSEVADYATQVPFINVLKQGREWFTATASTFDTGEAARLDRDGHGWLRSLTPTGAGTAQFDRACTLIFSMGTVQGGPQVGRFPYPAGPYVVRYEGQGTLEYRIAARKNAGLSTPGRDVIDVTPQTPGIQICITSTDPARTGDYLRNIRVYPPGLESLGEQGRAFHPDFLARLRPFSALRFMDWMRTNNSTQRTPDQRPLPGDYTYADESRGVPAEVMVQLSNELDAAPWFNMPHAATDDYVRTFAGVVQRALAPALPVYVEYSNEIWNDQFGQGRAIEAEGVSQFASHPGSNFDRRLNRFGERAAQMCTLWREVFGADASRVRCVVGGQAANIYIAETALNCTMSSLAPCRDKGIHGLAIAPYIGDWVGLPQHQATVAGWTAQPDGGLAKLFNELSTGHELNDRDSGGGMATVRTRMRNHAALAQVHNVKLLAYEGGQHLVGVGAPANDAAINRLFDSANRDERMGALYASYLQTWRESGGGLFMHFNDTGSATRFGRWGALEIGPQAASPKYNALVADTLSCVLDWAQTSFPALFSPPTTGVQMIEPYLFRAYPGTGQFLGLSTANGQIVTVGNLTGPAPLELGVPAPFLRQADCR
jgi:hypothetical protein